MKQDEEQLLAIAHKLGFADIKALREQPPPLTPSSSQPAKSNCSTRIAVISTGCAPNFPSSSDVCRKHPWWSMPVPDYVEKDQAAAYYEHGTPDGSRPGTVYRQHL